MHDWGEQLAAALTVLFAGLGLVGARRQWRADRRAAVAMTSLMVTVTLLLVFYLNFKNGYSQPFGRGLTHEVRERDYFFIVSFSAWGVWVAMGLAAMMEWGQARLAVRVPAPSRRWALVTPLLLVALIPLAGNHLTASRAGETMARDYARDLLRSLDPNAIVVTAGDNDTFPLWYARDVEGVRPDVSILVLSLANTNWYDRQLERAPRGPWLRDYYRGETDTLPDYVMLEHPATGALGPVHVTVDPQRVGRPYLERADLLVLQIIKDQEGGTRRPIYFATSTGNYADKLGLTAYLLSEGLVRHLRPQPVTASASVVPVQGLGFVDIERTKALAFGVYRGGETAARRRPRGWVDLASQNSLLPYAVIYDTLASALATRDPQTAARAATLRDAILANMTGFAARGSGS